ncbi:CRISPR system precrRNA processing endoribonuclease RAMP protein Cas6 [Methylococcus geothermalis]|uniref:CRISPR system precrRNA processing endoribonuclease RAMP protein Cas6 n=1 Tax=Methylococcus geothermalis TaxID=2681310 RepID=A0A858Q9P3_9GAMM|nr:CRISPR system precrRNA processing endoribonuclease RAMP protein Cas6 [Methylococcus geothermalis]QJD30444.1 CRISPR system precrRNA processing endoribonuclease RAMP protein Cas6 [Methylococcus geothermalis]
MTWPGLPLAHYRFEFSADHPIRLPDYPGSAWRGALGHALKRTVCVVRGTSCPDCLLYRACVYSYVFETPPPATAIKMRKYNAAPHPFILGMQTSPASQAFRLSLTLIGHAEHQLPYLVHALQQAGRQGIGNRDNRLELQAVRQTDSDGDPRLIWTAEQPLSPLPARTPAVPPVPKRCLVHLETPLRLRREGRQIGPSEFGFADLFGNLLRRISMLSYFHTATPLEIDFAGLNAQARGIAVEEPELVWHDWTRYSSRQDTTMQMGGLIGSFALDGAALAPFWPYLWLGQWTHAGKATSMGLGRYRIEAVSASRVPAPAESRANLPQPATNA